MHHDPQKDHTTYCTFRVNGHLLGVEVSKLQEVLGAQCMTRVPLASPLVMGLMNLRGQIVTAIDLRKRLLLPPAEGELRPMNVVIRDVDGPISLLVDEIGEVLQVDSHHFESPPENLRGEQRELIRGAFKLDNQLLLVLDTDRVIRTAA